MADEVETANKIMEVLSEAMERASPFEVVTKVFEVAGALHPSIACVGAVLGLVQCFLPDEKHEEILRRFEKLSNKIDQVRDDIKELEKMIKWEITELQYVEAVDRIQLGMQYCFEIGKSVGKDEKTRYQERLKEACANQKATLALNALLDGMAGKGLFRNCLLSDFSSTKLNGDRQKISALAARLLQLVCGGMMVIATHETVMRGKEGAEEITKSYEGQLKEVCSAVQSVLDGCVTNFEDNMKNDLTMFLGDGGSNEDLCSKVRDFMRDKYDWLENFCLVYNDLQGFEQHCFNGSRVSMLHHQGKCGIVFYRTKGEAPRFSDRYQEAHTIVDDTLKIVIDGAWFTNAEAAFDDIVAKLSESGIGWSGCAVTTQEPDLKFGGTFSSQVVSVIGNYATVVLLLQ